MPIMACIARPDFAESLSESMPRELLRNDLPGHAELVDEPAALNWLATVLDQLRPEAIDLRLRVDLHHEREALRERERGTAVQCDVGLPEQLEGHREDGAFRPRSTDRIAHRLLDLSRRRARCRASRPLRPGCRR